MRPLLDAQPPQLDDYRREAPEFVSELDVFVRTLQEHGLSVPRDAAVIGYDNIMLLPYVSPSMSTIAAPVHAIGATATKNLVAMIRGAQPTSSRPLVLPSKLVVRQSSRVLETPTLRRR